jgi:hypothetical protein
MRRGGQPLVRLSDAQPVGDSIAKTRGNGVDQSNGGFRRQVVESYSRRVEAVAAAPARQNQGHCGGGNVCVLVPDQRLREAGSRASGDVVDSGCETLLVGSAKEKSDEVGNVEEAGAPKPVEQAFVLVIRRRRLAKRDQELIADRGHEVGH